MPVAIVGVAAAVAGAAATSALVTAGISALAAAVIGGVVSAGIGFLGQKLVGSQQASSTPSEVLDQRGRGLQINVASAVEPIPVVYGTVRVGGVRVTPPMVTGGSNEYLHIVIIWCEGVIEAIDEIFLNGVSATDARFNGKAEFYHHFGEDDQLADPVLVSRVPEIDDTYRFSGTAYTYCRFTADPKVFNSMPVVSAQIRGRKVLDTRDSQTKFTNNPAMCIRDYLLNTRFGRGLPLYKTGEQSFQDAANFCEEQINVPDGEGGQVAQDRYTLDGVVNTGAPIPNNLRDLLTSCRGVLIETNGIYKLKIDKQDVVQGDPLNEDILVGMWSVGMGAQADFLNRVKAKYLDDTQDYQPALRVIENASFLAEDAGLLLEAELVYAFTTNPYRVEQLGAIALQQSRQAVTIEMRCTDDILMYETWDVVSVENETMGWPVGNGKLFRIVKMELDDDGLVHTTFLEYNDGTYTLPSQEPVDIPPDTQLPDPQDLLPPTNLAVIEQLYQTGAGAGVKSSAILTWNPSPSAFVTGYLPEMRIHPNTEWIANPVVSSDSDLLSVFFDVAPGMYDFRVTVINSFGTRTSAELLDFELLGLSAPPQILENLTIQVVSNLVILTWTQSRDLDVREGGWIHSRHSSNASATSVAETTSIGSALPGMVTTTVLPRVPGAYFLIPVDSTGNQGPPAIVSTEGAPVLEYSPVFQVVEDPTFPGTNDGTVVIDERLKLSGGANIDTWGNVDDVTGWDSEGGVNPEGTYYWSAGIDLGSKTRTLLVTEVESLITNQDDYWDARTTNIDTWFNVDGQALDEADHAIYVRSTDDDPTGSPTWGSWELLRLGEYNARAFEFKSYLTTTQPTHNIEISKLRARAEVIL